MNSINKLQTSIQRLSFTIALSILLQHGITQITSGHVDDFQDLSLSGWTEGAVSPNPPMVISSGGPAGDDDAYVRNVSSGAVGAAGGKWVMFNQSSNWTGNYLAAGVGEITMQVRNSGKQNVHLRLAFSGPGGTISSMAMFTILPDTIWQTIQFTIDPQIFVPLMGGGNTTTTFSAVNEFRILSNPMPANAGEDIAATVDIDNIHAIGLSSVNDIDHSSWTVFPNPAIDKLQLTHQDYDKPVSVILMTMLGQVLLRETLDQPYHLDVSELSSGNYLLLIDGMSVLPVNIGL